MDQAIRRVILLFLPLIFLAGCKEPTPCNTPFKGIKPCPKIIDDEKIYEVDPKAKVQVGKASYYASCFHGRRTSSGEKCNVSLLTAAHRTLPFGTMVKVTMLSNGKSVVVRINDRGPHTKGRIIDLSQAAAKKIGLHRAGTAKVKIERVHKSKL
jgi:rare lipoprotein A